MIGRHFPGWSRSVTAGIFETIFPGWVWKHFFFNFLGYDLKTYFLLKSLTGLGVRIATVAINSLPPFEGEDGRSLIGRGKLLLADIRYRLRYLTPYKCLNYAFRLAPLPLNSNRLSDFFFVDGRNAMRKGHPTVGPQTKVLGVHTFDYDLYLKNRENGSSEKNTAVFLDEYFPFHPDHVLAECEPCVTADRYYPALNRFFDHLEAALNLEVVVAAHPRSDYGNQDYFGDRKVIKGRTVELVRDCRLVILSCSTAINFAVLFRKPTIFITTDQVDIDYAPMITGMAERLGSPILNIERSVQFDANGVFNIDHGKYDEYRRDFIKMDGTPDSYFWDAVADAVAEALPGPESFNG